MFERAKLWLVKQATMPRAHMGVGMVSIVLAVVAILLAAILLPIALVEIYGANTSGWGASVITVWQTLFPILVVIGIALAVFMGLIGKSR